MNKQIKDIAIIVKHGHENASNVLNVLVNYLVSKGMRVRIDEKAPYNPSDVIKVPESEIIDHTDIAIVLGGDGTLIHTVHLINGKDIPVLGVNLGTLGFLTEIAATKQLEMIDKIIAGDFKTSSRQMFTITLKRDGEEILKSKVLNDAVINRGALSRIMRLEAFTEEGNLTSYRGDGLIISTPTGSTAYNMAAGGPVLYPSLKAFIITPICPHTFANRSVVLPDITEVHIELSEANGMVYLTLDGQEGIEMLEGDILSVAKSDANVTLIRSPEHNYFDILKQKLGWGQS